MEEIEINDEILNDGGYDGVWSADNYDDASIDVVEELPGVDDDVAASDTKQKRKRSFVVLIAVAASLAIAIGLAVSISGNKNEDVSQSLNKMSTTSIEVEDCLAEKEALRQQLEEEETTYIVSEKVEVVEYDLEEEGSKYSSDGDYGVELDTTTYYDVSKENDESPADYVGGSGDSNDGINVELIRRDLRGGRSTADKVEIERKIKRDRVCIFQLYSCI